MDFEAALPDIEWFQQRLERFGYETPRTGSLDEATVNVIGAFQMKYRPTNIDGMPDAETAAILDVLTTPVPRRQIEKLAIQGDPDFD